MIVNKRDSIITDDSVGFRKGLWKRACKNFPRNTLCQHQKRWDGAVDNFCGLHLFLRLFLSALSHWMWLKKYVKLFIIFCTCNRYKIREHIRWIKSSIKILERKHIVTQTWYNERDNLLRHLYFVVIRRRRVLLHINVSLFYKRLQTRVCITCRKRSSHGTLEWNTYCQEIKKIGLYNLYLDDRYAVYRNICWPELNLNKMLCSTLKTILFGYTTTEKVSSYFVAFDNRRCGACVTSFDQ